MPVRSCPAFGNVRLSALLSWLVEADSPLFGKWSGCSVKTKKKGRGKQRQVFGMWVVKMVMVMTMTMERQPLFQPLCSCLLMDCLFSPRSSLLTIRFDLI